MNIYVEQINKNENENVNYKQKMPGNFIFALHMKEIKMKMFNSNQTTYTVMDIQRHKYFLFFF